VPVLSPGWPGGLATPGPASRLGLRSDKFARDPLVEHRGQPPSRPGTSQPELPIRVREVGLDCLHRDEEALSYLYVAESGGGQFRNPQLAGCQRLNPLFPPATAPATGGQQFLLRIPTQALSTADDGQIQPGAQY
jgi:hypothetical protein